MLILGALLAVWGGVILALARPLHANWGQMIWRLRGAGFRKAPFGTRFIASPRGLHTMYGLGAGGLVAGAILIVLGLLQR